MNKILLKNLAMLITMTLLGFLFLYISFDVYLVLEIVIAIMCVLTAIGLMVWVPTYAKYVKKFIDINVSWKSYWIGVFCNLGGFSVAGIYYLVKCL